MSKLQIPGADTEQIKYKALGTTGWAPTEGKGWFYGTNSAYEHSGKDKKEQHYSLALFERYVLGNYLDRSTRCRYIGLNDVDGEELYKDDLVTQHNAGDLYRIDYYHGSSFAVPYDHKLSPTPLCQALKETHFDDADQDWHVGARVVFKRIGNVHTHQELVEKATKEVHL